MNQETMEAITKLLEEIKSILSLSKLELLEISGNEINILYEKDNEG